jgi:hypothetical protein
LNAARVWLDNVDAMIAIAAARILTLRKKTRWRKLVARNEIAVIRHLGPETTPAVDRRGEWLQHRFLSARKKAEALLRAGGQISVV